MARIKTRIRIGDVVAVISGAHKGQNGTVKRFNADRSRVFVEGVNKVRRHEKPQPALGREGGITEKEASIHISNVKLLVDGTATRVGYRIEDGTKVRFAKATGEIIAAPKQPGR
jgi:large subunit ribosomal protein L24